MNSNIQASTGSVLSMSILLKRGCFLLLALFFISCQPKPPTSELYVIAQVPDWQLKNQDAKSFGSADLAGKVYIANFIFSRCPSVCPKMLLDTAKIQERLKEDKGIALVTFTVEPQFDTPEVLTKLAAKYGADTQVWSFITHEDKEALFKLYRDGYKVNVSDAQPAQDLYDIAHSEKMVLVDKKGQIRGYYGYEPEKVEQLIIDARHLVED